MARRLLQLRMWRRYGPLEVVAQGPLVRLLGQPGFAGLELGASAQDGLDRYPEIMVSCGPK